MSGQFVPRYYEIEQALRGRVAKLPAGAALPSDAELCLAFRVSRMTARNAVQRLVQDGLVHRVPGRGTFVAPQPPHRTAGKVLSFTEEMRRRGRIPRSRLVACAVREPTATEALRLRLPSGRGVCEVRRVRLADDEPLALERAVFPDDCAEAILAADLERESLHATLVAAGRVPTAGEATLTAEAASAEDGKLLGVDPGSALLVERRVIVDQEGEPIELSESRYVPARYSLDVEFVVER